MSYQKCPVCDGVGMVDGGYFTRAGNCNTWASKDTTECCLVCKGTGLIDEITGLPPAVKKAGEILDGFGDTTYGCHV